ncbi:MAG: single-stranded-DNA-specific exonuclease RecJ, partial [Phycisphaerales bacterium]|nr:single-stranded-DNA-specific exonuclease RecJ [Phycisphaerales bacterium]
YGDYDVDGMTATAILYHMLRHLEPGARVGTYVPHRLDEGYGLNAEALRHLKSDGASVVVSVDCGITAVEPARVAREAGLDLIITDHHTPPADVAGLPEAFAIVHPALPGSTYGCRHLCGAGVAFKLAWRLATMAAGRPVVDAETRRLLLRLLSLAALGTIADVVPLTDENRVIASNGLRLVRETGLPGIDALIEVAGLNTGVVDAEDVGFKLGPRLNACGRMGHAREAVELLTDVTPERAAVIARALNEQNTSRRDTERRIFEEACERAEGAGMTGVDRRAIVLAAEDWHPGVVGIVCSRLIGRFHRPTILMQRDGDECRGSGRSIDGFNLHGGLRACASHLTRFGGHDMAAGLALASSSLDAFTEAFIAHANGAVSEEMLTPQLRVDCAVGIEELTPQGVRAVLRLGPFGRDNPHPNLLLEGMRVTHDARAIGAQGRHLQVLAQSAGAQALRLVGWGMGDVAPRLRAGALFDAVIRPKLNEFRGVVNVEAEVRDLRLTEGAEVRTRGGIRARPA